MFRSIEAIPGRTAEHDRVIVSPVGSPMPGRTAQLRTGLTCWLSRVTHWESGLSLDLLCVPDQ